MLLLEEKVLNEWRPIQALKGAAVAMKEKIARVGDAFKNFGAAHREKRLAKKEDKAFTKLEKAQQKADMIAIGRGERDAAYDAKIKQRRDDFLGKNKELEKQKAESLRNRLEQQKRSINSEAKRRMVDDNYAIKQGKLDQKPSKDVKSAMKDYRAQIDGLKQKKVDVVKIKQEPKKKKDSIDVRLAKKQEVINAAK